MVSIIRVYNVLWFIKQAYCLVYRTHLSLSFTQKLEGDETVCLRVQERRGEGILFLVDIGLILG